MLDYALNLFYRFIKLYIQLSCWAEKEMGDRADEIVYVFMFLKLHQYNQSEYPFISDLHHISKVWNVWAMSGVALTAA